MYRFKLICTTYSSTKKGLIFKNSWIETIGETETESADVRVLNYLHKYQVPTDNIPYPSMNSISPLLVGQTELDNVIIHIYIVKF